ncbi:MAG: DUF4013 domain-containing protein [Opitutales bacterium]
MAKCLLGAVLLAIPILHFFAFGYLGRVVAATARGEPFDLPEWEGWRELFLSGIVFFAIFLGLGGGLFLLAWIVSLPFHAWAGPLAYVPFSPAILLTPPLVAAGWYRYCELGEVAEAFRVTELLRLLQRVGFPLLLPTLAFIGFLFVGLPLFPLAFFLGGIVVFFFYSSIFSQMEQAGPSSVPFSVL